MRFNIPPADDGMTPDLAPLFDGIVKSEETPESPPGDQFDDWLPDPVYYEDLRLAREPVLEALQQQWRAGTLDTPPPTLLQVPREGGRSLAALALPFALRVVAHAVIAGFAPGIAGALLRDKVYGFEYHPQRIPRFSAPNEGTELAAEAALELASFRTGEIIDVVDVAAFGETATPSQLGRVLSRAGVRLDQVNFLDGILATAASGLPSIDDAFAFVYNYYLQPVDEALAQQRVNFFRFRDEYYLLSGEGLAPVRQALMALGLTPGEPVRRLDGEMAFEAIYSRAAEVEPGEGPLEEPIGRIGDTYLFAVFDADCQSDCFEVYFGIDAVATKRAFFDQCRSGALLDGVRASPCLRAFHRARRSAAWRVPPLDDAGPEVRAYLAEIGVEREALRAALATAVRQGSAWQVSWAAPMLADLGSLGDGATADLRAVLDGAQGPHAEAAARLALARASELPPEALWRDIDGDADPFQRRTMALVASIIRRRHGDDAAWRQAGAALQDTDPHLLRFLERL